MKNLFLAFCILSLAGGCTHFTRLSDQKISGSKNFIFIRYFSQTGTPPEVAKLVSDKFYTKLSSQKYFNSRRGKTFDFDFYFGQPCPEGYDCYYITGQIKGYNYEDGCCGLDGVEATSSIKFWDDLSKKPLFEISEWNNEVFDPGELTELQAVEFLAEDSADALIRTLLKELSKN